MKGICNSCNLPSYIVNKKHTLCNDCNHFRLHGETVLQTQQKQQKKWLEKAKKKDSTKVKVVKSYTIKQATSKTAKKNQELSELKFSISEKALYDGTYFCKGCGHSNGGLDRSHILSEKQRPDLALEEENIDLLCRDCHMKWESWDILKMVDLICFEKYLSYIFINDEETFFKIFVKMEEQVSMGYDRDSELLIKIDEIVEKYLKKFT